MVINLRLLLLAFLLVVLKPSIAQEELVWFLPEKINSGIRNKPFFKEGLLFRAINSTFKNDTNCFTIYLINNSDSSVSVPVYGENYSQLTSITGVSMDLIPENFKPYKTILTLSNQNFGSHDYQTTKKLKAGYFIKQNIKIACPACKENSKIKVRLTLNDFSGFETGKNIYYFSNAFNVYYHPKAFYNYNKPDYIKKNIFLENINENSKESYYIKDSADSKIYIAFKDIKGDSITRKQLKKITNRLSVYSGSEEVNSYRIRNYILMLVEKNSWAITHINSNSTSVIPKESIKKIRKLKKGDSIDFTNIEIYHPNKGLLNVRSRWYIIK